MIHTWPDKGCSQERSSEGTSHRIMGPIIINNYDDTDDDLNDDDDDD